MATKPKVSGELIKVLHVDDEPDFAEMVATFLEREDDRFEIKTVSNPADGLERLADAEFDCIVSDYDMPGRNGIEFLETVRSDYPDLPFILFTGKGSEQIASKAITAGVTDYLQKGVGTEQYTILINRIANAVDRFRVRHQIDLRHQALETATEGLSIIRPDGTFTYVNSAFAELFGYDRDELIGSHWSGLYHGTEAERLENDILPAVEETGYWSGETVRLTKRGDRLVTDHRLTRAGRDTIVCTAKDLTAQRAAHGEQGTTPDLLLDTVGTEAYGFFTLDHEGYVTRWNAGAERLCGYDAAEILGKHLSTLCTEADREKNAPEELLETAWSGDAVTEEKYLLQKDGSRTRAEVTVSASYDAEGTLRGFGVITRNVSEPEIERDEHAAQLRQTRAKLEALFEESPDLINFHDRNGNITDPNPELCRETGYDAGELTDMKVWELDQRIDPETAHEFWNGMVDGARNRIDGLYKRADGSTFPVEAHVRRLRFNEEDLFVVIARNITDRVERERSLRQERDQLEEFAGVVSHDLRNPLQLADGRLELAREECDSDHLDVVDEALARMDRIIEDVLRLARKGRQVGSTERIALRDAVDDAWDVAAHTASGAALRYVVADRPLPTVEANENRLRQLLENLLSNAIEHSRSDVTVTVGRVDDGFYVEDDGPGISPDVRDEVFTAGYTTAREGTGFGLSIVKQVAEAHGWTVSVTDGVAGGARFEITGVEFVE